MERSGQPESNFTVLNEYVKAYPLQERKFKEFVIWGQGECSVDEIASRPR